MKIQKYIGNSDVTDQTTIIVDHVKNKVYNIKSRNYKDKPRKT